MQATSEKRNIGMREIWGDDSYPDMSAVFRSCLGYASCPGWNLIQQEILNYFGSFKGLKTIELGCGEAKVSLLFSLLGAETTIIDYSSKQLKRAKYIADSFEVDPIIAEDDLLELPKSFLGQYDVSMSFGTAEHFFGNERQRVFNSHFKVLRERGIAILWVPNRYGILFHIGVHVRRIFKRQVCMIAEAPFTRNELFLCGKESGLLDIKIAGGELLTNDFYNFILDIPRLLGLPKSLKAFKNAHEARNELLQCMVLNSKSITPLWDNVFSYPLILIGRRL